MWNKPYYHNKRTPPVYDERGLYPLVGGDMWGENALHHRLLVGGMKSRPLVERQRAVKKIKADFCRRASALTGAGRVEWDSSARQGLVLADTFVTYEWYLLLANVIEVWSILGRKGYFRQ